MKLERILDTAVTSKTNAIIWGSPGIGKTARILAWAARHGYLCKVVIASVREPSDFAGLPILTSDGVVLSPPKWAKELAELAEDKIGILVLDEISCAPPATQAALLRVVQDRVVGDLPLKDNIRIISAANPADIASGGWDLTPALANRFGHYYLTPDAGEWVAWLSQQQNISPKLAGRAASFINRKPTHLLDQKLSAETGNAWPSPRSWYNGLCAMQTLPESDVDSQVELLSAFVGSNIALEYGVYVKNLDLPDPQELLDTAMAGKEVTLPTRQDQLYSTIIAVTSLVMRDNILTPKSWEAGWKIISSTPHKDLAVLGAQALVRKIPPGASIPKEIIEFTGIMSHL